MPEKKVNSGFRPRFSRVACGKIKDFSQSILGIEWTPQAIKEPPVTRMLPVVRTNL